MKFILLNLFLVLVLAPSKTFSFNPTTLISRMEVQKKCNLVKYFLEDIRQACPARRLASVHSCGGKNSSKHCLISVYKALDNKVDTCQDTTHCISTNTFERHHVDDCCQALWLQRKTFDFLSRLYGSDFNAKHIKAKRDWSGPCSLYKAVYGVLQKFCHN